MNLNVSAGIVPFIDKAAGTRLRELREQRTGMSPEALSREIHAWAAANHGWKAGSLDAFTIRRAERGIVPSIRTRFVLCQFFGVEFGVIWNQDAWIKVDVERLPEVVS